MVDVEIRYGKDGQRQYTAECASVVKDGIAVIFEEEKIDEFLEESIGTREMLITVKTSDLTIKSNYPFIPTDLQLSSDGNFMVILFRKNLFS